MGPTYLTTTFIVFALGGILDAGYLTYQHSKQKPLVCPLDHDCSQVTESRWSRIFGLRNEILGFLFYILNLGVILGSLSTPHLISELYFLLLIMNAAGFLFSLFLVWVQIFMIKDYCFYCMISALLSTLLFINIIALYLGRERIGPF